MESLVIMSAAELWSYLSPKIHLDVFDCIIVCGGHDRQVILKATELYNVGRAKKIIVSGGLVRKVYGEKEEERKEAYILRDLLLREGITTEDILIESNSINTTQNFTLSVELAEGLGYNFKKYLMIQKPYVILRTILTLKKVSHNVQISVSSQDISFSDYLSGDIPQEKILNMLVGEVQRIIEYPKIGWTVETSIPTQVLRAYNYLIDQGYTQRLFSKETLQKFKDDADHIELK